MSTGRRVAVILPAGEALATDSDAPAKGAAKLAQVVPYALEERVADEIENLHFAHRRTRLGHGRVPVVVVERARLDAWLAELRAAGLESAGYLLRRHAAARHARPDDRAARRRHAHAAHRRCAAARAAGALDQPMPSRWRCRCRRRRSPDSNPPRSGCCCMPATTNGRRTSMQIDAFRDRFTGVKVQLLPSGSLSVLAPAAAAGDAVNLLQGALAVASPLELDWRSWRVAAVLGGFAALPAPRRALLRTQPPAQERSHARCQHPGRLPRRHARPAERHQRAPARRTTARRNPRWRRRRHVAAGACRHRQCAQRGADRQDRRHYLP